MPAEITDCKKNSTDSSSEIVLNYLGGALIYSTKSTVSWVAVVCAYFVGVLQQFFEHVLHLQSDNRENHPWTSIQPSSATTSSTFIISSASTTSTTSKITTGTTILRTSEDLSELVRHSSMNYGRVHKKLSRCGKMCLLKVVDLHFLKFQRTASNQFVIPLKRLNLQVLVFFLISSNWHIDLS